MMKYLLKFTTYLYIVLFVPFVAGAQDPFGGSYMPPKLEILDTAQFKVVYDWTYEHPISNGFRTTEYTLLVGPRISKYASTTEIRGDSLQYAERNSTISYREWMQKRNRAGADARNNYLLRYHNGADSVEVHEKYIVRFSDSKMAVPEFYYFAASPQTAWSFTGRTKTIRGIECTEAKGRLHGRDWTIWFAESIPIFEGPWELSGAPGLILEAYDSKNEHHFTLVEMGPNRSLILRANNDGRKLVTRARMREQRSASDNHKLQSARLSLGSDVRMSMNYLDLE